MYVPLANFLVKDFSDDYTNVSYKSMSFVNLAFGSVVVVVILVIITIIALKHVQIRRREFDKSELLSLLHMIRVLQYRRHSYQSSRKDNGILQT